jgi:hypothetical protein
MKIQHIPYIVLAGNPTSRLNHLLSKEVVALQEASHYHILLKEAITHQDSIGYHLLSREATIHQDSTYYHMLSKEEKEVERTMEVEVHFIKEGTIPTSTKSCFMITKGQEQRITTSLVKQVDHMTIITIARHP